MFKYLKYVVINLLLLSFFVDTAYAKIKRKGGSKTKNSTNELSVEELEKQGWITNNNVFPSGSPNATKGGMITILGAKSFLICFVDTKFGLRRTFSKSVIRRRD